MQADFRLAFECAEIDGLVGEPAVGGAQATERVVQQGRVEVGHTETQGEVVATPKRTEVEHPQDDLTAHCLRKGENCAGCVAAQATRRAAITRAHPAEADYCRRRVGVRSDLHIRTRFIGIARPRDDVGECLQTCRGRYRVRQGNKRTAHDDESVIVGLARYGYHGARGTTKAGAGCVAAFSPDLSIDHTALPVRIQRE
jgi:hypothetical protein